MTFRLSSLALVAALGFSAVAGAQAPPPPPGDMPPRHGDMAAMREHHAMREAAHLKALHDALNIRSDREAAFQSFAATMHPPRPPDGAGMGAGMGQGMGQGMGMKRWKDHEQSGAMTAPERVDAMLKGFDEHTARARERLAAHAAAVHTFYAALSPEQKRTFDSLPGLMGHGMMDGHGGGMHGHGPMGGGQGMGGEPGRRGGDDLDGGPGMGDDHPGMP